MRLFHLLVLIRVTAFRFSQRPKHCAITLRLKQEKEDEYPWQFAGRLWFQPSLIRASHAPDHCRVLQLAGWTVGGAVALEYDDSPCGAYREFVSIAGAVTKRGAMGFYGRGKIFVSTQEAKEICRKNWGVPVELADISFEEDGELLTVKMAPVTDHDEEDSLPRSQIVVGGWSNTRIATQDNDGRRGTHSVLWTPTIKALWLPFVPLSAESKHDDGLPLFRLRLSSSSWRFCWCSQESLERLNQPLPVGFTVDNVLIEISRVVGDL